MPAVYEIRFDGDPAIKEWFGSRGFYYEFPDSQTLELRPTIGWCCQCKDFVSVEWIATLREIEEELVELHDPNSRLGSIYTVIEPPFDGPRFNTLEFHERRARIYAEAKAKAALRVEWRKARKSPPRCLHCGSTELRLPNDDGRMEIPGRGSAKLEGNGTCSTDFLNWFYTPEGIRLPRDTKPSNWRLPEDDA